MSELHKFIFEGLPVRGALVRLTGAWQEVLARQGQSADKEDGNKALNHPAVSELMGQMSAAAILLHTTIKFDGTLLLQIQGDGPLKMAVAEAQNDMGVRATATIEGEVPPLSGIDALCNVNGQGRCAITLDATNRQPGQQPYQGIVALSDENGMPFTQLSDVIQGYMELSEQLPTRIILAADKNCAAGLLIQRLPVEGDRNLGEAERENIDEGFNRIAALAMSLKNEEILSLNGEDILHRLFWQEKLQQFQDVQQPHFHCTCSQERVAHMLKNLGEEEVTSLIEEQGKAEVTCNFCGALYSFDAVDALALFVQEDKQPPASAALQ